CWSGSRSAFATKALHELGYETAVNLSDGFAGWKRNGYEFVTPVSLAPAQRKRYARHLLIPEVGEEGQQKLLDSRVLLIGAGGPGSPALASPPPARGRAPRGTCSGGGGGARPARRRRSPPPPPVAGPWGSSIPTVSTIRPPSARSSTRPSGSAS